MLKSTVTGIIHNGAIHWDYKSRQKYITCEIWIVPTSSSGHFFLLIKASEFFFVYYSVVFIMSTQWQQMAKRCWLKTSAHLDSNSNDCVDTDAMLGALYYGDWKNSRASQLGLLSLLKETN